MPTSGIFTEEDEIALRLAVVARLQQSLLELDTLGLALPAIRVAEAIAALGGEPSAGPGGTA